MRLSGAAQARRKFRCTSGAERDKQIDGLQQAFFLLKTVLFISHILTALPNA